jgi:hypothetical protein
MRRVGRQGPEGFSRMIRTAKRGCAIFSPGYVIRLGKFSREPEALTIDHESECAVSDVLTRGQRPRKASSRVATMRWGDFAPRP